MKHAKALGQPTIALIVTRHQGEPILVDTLNSVEEILELEMAIVNGEAEPLKRVLDFRIKQASEDEEFADFVEGLIAQPFVKPDVQEHAVQWFKSRAKIESFQKAEDEASQIIATYAFQIYTSNPSKTDFMLAGPKAKVRIKIIDLGEFKDFKVA